MTIDYRSLVGCAGIGWCAEKVTSCTLSQEVGGGGGGYWMKVRPILSMYLLKQLKIANTEYIFTKGYRRVLFIVDNHKKE